MKNLNRIYYRVRPFIPRLLAVELRRLVVISKLRKCGDIWPIDHSASKPPAGWKGWPDDKRFALVLTHDVDTARGHDNCLRLAKMEKDAGFVSSFNFVCRRYPISSDVIQDLDYNGFEIGVHGVYHDGKKFDSREEFNERASIINEYLVQWKSVGFRSPAMQRNLEWMHDLNIEYDSSTFDTDPFEPQPDGVCTIFPFLVTSADGKRSYVELPYTLPQDFTLFVMMKHSDIRIWKEKLDWLVSKGGMVLINTHPDYMSFDDEPLGREEYPSRLYKDFLEYVRNKYEGQYWNCLPRDLARFTKGSLTDGNNGGSSMEEKARLLGEVEND
jgi:hypothetical protein